MDVEFRCPKCAKRYKTSEEHSGKKTKCSECGEIIEVPFPPLEIPDEVTDGGSTVYRHEARSREFEMAIGDGENIERIEQLKSERVADNRLEIVNQWYSKPANVPSMLKKFVMYQVLNYHQNPLYDLEKNHLDQLMI